MSGKIKKLHSHMINLLHSNKWWMLSKTTNIGLISIFTNYVRLYKKNREIQNGGFIARIQRRCIP